MATALMPVAQAQLNATSPASFDEARESAGAERLNGAMKAIVADLQAEATRRLGLKQPIEQRWIEDLEQYHGRYDQETEKVLVSEERSRLFINLTRPKTNAMGARFKDMLFPTDERNWAVSPTPVPKLTEAAERAAAEAQALLDQAAQAQAAANDNQNPQLADQAQQAVGAADQAKQVHAQLNAQIEEAKRRASNMAEEIDDQLTECNWPSVKRDQIDWAMKIGTGITKGPVTGDLVRKGWQQAQKQQPALDGGQSKVDPQTGKPQMQPQVGPDGKPVMGDYQLNMAYGTQPAHRLVDPWGFFPDPDVARIEDGNGNFERHLKNPTKLRKLAKLSGFDVDAIRRLLATKPISNAPSYIAGLRNIRSEAQAVTGPLYHVWEYNGPLEPEQMRTLALATNNRMAFEGLGEVDPLQEVHACVWFCDGEVLKFALYPLDSGEPMYSVFNLVKDESSIFGYGMPAILRDLQSAVNAAWRTMMDNAGLSAGPQVIIDRTAIEPADGDNKLRQRKIWYANKGISKENPPFQVFNIPSNQMELANIIALAERFIDVTSSMPQIAQGEQGAGITKTAQGMAILMNSTNVVFRDAIKNFDDDVIVPDIRRQYDWNMQFNPREDIKGDYDVKATGSSVLLVREMQAQSLMTIAQVFGGHPVYGPMLKNRDLLRKIFQAHMIPADEVMLSDEQIDMVVAQAAKQAEEQAKAANTDQLKLEIQGRQIDADIALANMQHDYKLRELKYTRDTEMMKAAAAGNVDLEKIRAMLERAGMEIDHKERALAVEAAVTQAQPPEQATGGGSL